MSTFTKLLTTAALATALMSSTAMAETVKIALVVKALGIGFFEAAAKGAEEAAKEAEEAHLPETEQIKRREIEQEHVEERKSSNRAAEMLNMSISEKVRLAVLGSRADRDVLIRDGNRLIHMSAVTSPKNQLKDIVAWSANKQLPENVVIYIANNGKYKRNYNIILNLCNNPKTPLVEAARLMQQLQAKDLANLIKNRNVSGNLRRMAAALRDQRMKKKH